jgi:hypothetical protein
MILRESKSKSIEPESGIFSIPIEDLERLRKRKAVVISIAKEVLEGGLGSGHWGHKGRPGMVGGSVPGVNRLREHDVDAMIYMLSNVTGSRFAICSYLDTLPSEDVLKSFQEILKAKEAEPIYGNLPHIDRIINSYYKGEEVSPDMFINAADEIKGKVVKKEEALELDYYYFGMFVSRLSEEDGHKLLDNVGEIPDKLKRDDVVRAMAYFGPGTASVRASEMMYPRKPDFFSSDYETAKKAIVDGWVHTAGSPDSIAMQFAATEMSGNEGKFLYIHGNGYPMGRPIPNPTVKENLEKIYKETQDFYAKKGVKELVIYRGITRKSTVFQPIESWTLDYKTAKKFDGGKDGSVFKAKIPVEGILMSFESMKGIWPPEKELRGKKEITVLGGMLKDIEVIK